MKFYKLIHVAISGCVVYTLAVACSGGGGGGGLLADAAAELFGGGGGLGGFWSDVLSDPVSDAKAAPPEIKEAPCDLAINGSHYGEVAFQGKTANELALAHALVHSTTPSDGYEWYQASYLAIKDGAVRVWCYSDSAGVVSVDGVRVLVPAP